MTPESRCARLFGTPATCRSMATCNTRSKITRYGLSRSTRSSPESMLECCAPSTADQIRLNLVADAQISFIFEPPGYQLHVWHHGSGLVTHTAVFSDWPGADTSGEQSGEV